jgi:hypothetical protein
MCYLRSEFPTDVPHLDQEQDMEETLFIVYSADDEILITTPAAEPEFLKEFGFQADGDIPQHRWTEDQFEVLDNTDPDAAEEIDYRDIYERDEISACGVAVTVSTNIYAD